MSFERLSHGRYKESEEVVIDFTPPTDIDFKIVDQNGVESCIPVEELKLQLQKNKPELLPILMDRLKSLESFVSLEFDSTECHVAIISTRKSKHGSRYLNDMGPCYAYTTLREYEEILDLPSKVRAPNGQNCDLAVPLYLNEMHANSMSCFLCPFFTDLVNVNRTSDRVKWHDLWIPDTLAHLMTQAIVDWSNCRVSEPGIQFVVDCLRLMVYCCQNSEEFPLMLSLMKKFVQNFIFHPLERTREKVPDLGDLMQWFGVLSLVDENVAIMNEDMVSALIVEAIRRQARWVGNFIIKTYRLRPRSRRNGHKMVPDKFRPGAMYRKQLWRRETETEMLLRFAQTMTKQELLDCWWKQGRISWRVILYSMSFCNILTKGKTWEMLQEKYEPVLGAVYPEDIAAIRNAKAEIEQLRCLSDCIEYMARLTGHDTYLMSDRLHAFCLWAIKNRNGYVSKHPLMSAKRNEPFQEPLRKKSRHSKVPALTKEE